MLHIDEDSYQIKGINWFNILYSIWQQLTDQNYIEPPNTQNLQHNEQLTHAFYHLMTLVKLYHIAHHDRELSQNDGEEDITLQQANFNRLKTELTNFFKQLDDNDQLILLFKWALNKQQALPAIIQVIDEVYNDCFISQASLNTHTELTHTEKKAFIQALQNLLSQQALYQWLLNYDPLSLNEPNNPDQHTDSKQPKRRLQILAEDFPVEAYNSLAKLDEETFSHCLSFLKPLKTQNPWDAHQGDYNLLSYAINVFDFQLTKQLINKGSVIYISDPDHGLRHWVEQKNPPKDVYWLVTNNSRTHNQATPLLEAIYTDLNPAYIEDFISQYAQIDAPGYQTQETPLMLAVKYNRMAIAQLLLDRNAQVNWADQHGNTALLLLAKSLHESHRTEASLKSQKRLCQQLIAQGASTTITNQIGQAAIDFLPTQLIDPDEFANNALIENQRPLLFFYSSPQRLEQLINNGAQLAAQDQNGQTLLHHAILGNNERVSQLVLENNPQVALIQDTIEGNTALMLAASQGNTRLTKLILEKQPQTACIRNHLGKTPLQKAAKHNFINIIKLIITHNPEAVNLLGSLEPVKQSLQQCIEQPYLTVRCGYNPQQFEKPDTANTQRQANQTVYARKPPLAQCLHLFNQDETLLGLMLRLGAKTNIQYKLNEHRLSLINEICAEGHTQTLAQLLDHNFFTGSGNLIPEKHHLINIAVINDQYETAKMLIDRGFEINNFPQFASPIYLASFRGLSRMVKLLIDNGADTGPTKRNIDIANFPARRQLRRRFLPQIWDFNTLIVLGNKEPIYDNQIPIFYALRYGNYDELWALINQGAPVNIMNKDNMTPLEFIITKDAVRLTLVRTKLIKLLIDNNAAIAPLFNKPELAETIKNNPTINKILDANYTEQCDPNNKTTTPLILAVHSGDIDQVKRTIKQGALVNRQDELGRTPMHVAAQLAYPDIIKLLEGYNANAQIQDVDGNLPLHMAAHSGDSQTIDTLLLSCSIPSLGVNNSQLLLTVNKWDNTPLETAMHYHNLEAVKRFIHHGGVVHTEDDIRISALCSSKNAEQKTTNSLPTTLHKALCRQQSDSVELLLANGITPHGDKDLKAAVLWDPVSVERLLQNGCTPLAPTDNTETALHTATKFGRRSAAQALLQYGADINATISDLTPLHYAIHYWQYDMAQWLINHESINLDAQTTFGDTALHLATYYNIQTIIRTLLMKGANLDIPNNRGFTPVHAALINNKIEMAQLLLHYRPDIKHVVDKLLETHTLGDLSSTMQSMLLENAQRTNSHATSLLQHNMPGNFLGKSEFVTNQLVQNDFIKAQSKSQFKETLERSDLCELPFASILTALNNEIAIDTFSHNCLIKLNARDMQKRTPLHIATLTPQQLGCDVQALKQLRQQLTNFYEVSRDGSFINQDRQEIIIQLLVEQGTDVNSQDQTGKTPLHYAIQNGYLQLTQKLIELNASTNINDNDNKPALNYLDSSQHSLQSIQSFLNLFKSYQLLSHQQLAKLIINCFDHQITGQIEKRLAHKNNQTKVNMLRRLTEQNSPMHHVIHHNISKYIPEDPYECIRFSSIFRDLRTTLLILSKKTSTNEDLVTLKQFADTLKYHRHYTSSLFFHPKSWHDTIQQLDGLMNNTSPQIANYQPN